MDALVLDVDEAPLGTADYRANQEVVWVPGDEAMRRALLELMGYEGEELREEMERGWSGPFDEEDVRARLAARSGHFTGGG
jgi:hypothetical protein